MTTRHTAPTGPPAPRDAGAALLLTLFVTSLVMIVGTTILGVTVSNLRSARASQDAAAALDAADAGLSQALAHLRTFGVAALDCSPTCAAGYGSSANPAEVVLDGPADQSYRVWIEKVAPLPAHNPGTYRVHATGYAGRGVRAIVADVVVGTRPVGLPLAVFARSVNGGGTASVTRESIISTGCVYSRSKILMEGTDAAFGIPAAVHSSQYVSTSNGTNSDCGPSSGAIHKDGICNAAYPYDQDVQGGGPLTGACAGAAGHPAYYGEKDYDLDGVAEAHGSRISDATSLRRLFGIPEKPFTEAQLDNLRDVARSQGQYYLGPGYTAPNPSTTPHSVMFFDLTAGGNTGALVDLKDVTGWGRAPGLDEDSAACLPRSLLIIVVGGNVRLNGQASMVANIVLTSPAPNGHVSKANGTADLIGTIYADSVDLTGTIDVSLDECFVQNLSPSLIDTTLTVVDYREIDRTDP